MLIRLVWVGRTRDPAAAALLDDYTARIRRFCPIEVIQLKDAPGKGRSRAAREGREILARLAGPGLVVVLDEAGERMTSAAFARFLERSLAGRAVVSFVLGGPEGLGGELASAAATRLSLSPMTLTHEMARIVLAEQIYRAFSILKGTPYHR